MNHMVSETTTYPEICELRKVLEEADDFKQSLAFAYLHGMRDAEKCNGVEEKEKKKERT